VKPLRILTLSTVFPNPVDRSLGLFVRSRLERLSEAADIYVITPVSWIDYGNPASRFRFQKIQPFESLGDSLRVEYTRWFYPPFGGALNAGCLFAQTLSSVVRLRRRFPFQLIDAHFGHPEGVAAALLSTVVKVPFILTLRGNEPLHAAHPVRRRAMAWAMRRAARIITVAESLREFAIRLGAAPERTKTIPNGVDEKTFYPRDRRMGRQRHGIHSESQVILSAGSLVPRKGHHVAIRALRLMKDCGARAELHIAGAPGAEGGYLPELQKLVRELDLEDRVRFVGQLSQAELAEMMSAADVFCLASSLEGWPNVLHEALACGLPAVATDVGAARDLVPSEEFGLVVPPGDPSALADALTQALGKPWDRSALARKAGSRSWSDAASELLHEIEGAIRTAD